ncbi:peptidase domain-containing ABC transporter [Sphingobacterium sp.]|uniref:peptidase domain-containing ABC transporter n=1 Tax=Sphingobacterium sp. TaxID=341027 RepID=UPI00289D2E43|nr:peptidase domain-containing ABC transporter [Sphingobacterium sp.]
MKYPYYIQHDQMDCGPTCLRIVAKYYGKKYTLEYLRELAFLNRNGVSLLNLKNAAVTIGFSSDMLFSDINNLIYNFSKPSILHWNTNHFVVLFDIKYRNDLNRVKFIIADPRHGIVHVDIKTFLSSWISVKEGRGTILQLRPTESFYRQDEEKKNLTNSYQFLIAYLRPHRKLLSYLILILLTGSILSLIIPFLTQILVDLGIGELNINIVYLVLCSQLFLFIGGTVIDIFRNWLMLFINTRISLTIISDFLRKLFDLPIRFFDSKSVGDITQRINDHTRVEQFLTGTALTTLISLINVGVFIVVLGLYDFKIFAVFTVLTALAICWIFFYQKRRKEIDYKRFNANRENHNKLYEIIIGMPEIKLYAGEDSKRESWEKLQIKLFDLNIKSLSLEQLQKTGFLFLLQLKNIFISYIAAREVIAGNFSLGTMLSISFIIGQTNSPLEQLISFFRHSQDARLSLDRMKEIHNKENEERRNGYQELSLSEISSFITFKEVSFQYGGPKSPFVLENINLEIPIGKVTAIVGSSGSGKTTLMKLLLKFYDCTKGSISLDGINLDALSPKWWRDKCGTVMQDGHIFSDTILKNIAIDGKEIDEQRIQEALYISNLTEFVESLPNGLETRIGADGNGLSGGQRQRLFIARAVYKNPSLLLFDEATSALDANNEKVIMERLNGFFQGRTVIVIAHRLSTVRNADNTIVLRNGEVVEAGSHTSLLEKKGFYYELVKNQLELEENENHI